MILERIKQFIDYKGIAISAFEKSIGMSNASLGKSLKTGGTIGADKLGIILSTYPEINLHWLVTGEGEMLKESPQPKLIANQVPSLSNTEILLRDLLAERDNEIKALNEIIWELKEEIGSLKNQLEHKGETARGAGGSSVANAG